MELKFAGEEQGPAFARSDIDKGELRKVNLQPRDHFPKQLGFNRLIIRMQQAKHARAPSDCRTCGINSMLPIVINIAVALPFARWGRITRELPDECKQLAGRGSHASLRP